MTRKLTSLLRRVLILAVMLAAGGAAAWFYAKHRVNDEIRQRVETRLAEHYSGAGLSVTVESAQLVEGQGIIVRGISVIDAHADVPGTEIAHADELFLACDARLPNLLFEEPRVTQTIVRRLTVRAAKSSDGKWNVERLFPPPNSGGSGESSADVIIEDGTLELVRSANDTEHAFRLSDIDLTVSPQTDAGDFETASHRDLAIAGSFAGNHVERVDVTGSFRPDDASWSFQGGVENLRVSPGLRDSLPVEVAQLLAPLAALRATASFAFRASSAAEPTAQPTFQIRGKLQDGQIDDGRLPYPLTNLAADVFCDHQGLRVENMTAQSGLGTIELSCQRDGFSSDSPTVLTAKARQVALNQRLLEVLPEEMRQTWNQYSPTGTVDCDLKLTFDGQRWQPDLLVNCRDVSFAYFKMPYRLESCAGTVHWTDNVCTVKLTALAAGRTVHMNGEIQNPGPNFTGGIDVTVDGPIPLDEKLFSSLTEKSQAIVRSFRPSGMVKLSGRFGRREPGGQIEKQVNIELLDCSMQYEKFPYPIERIRGKLTWTNDQWLVQNVTGHNDSGYMVCNGSWVPGLLKLTFVGTDIPLEDDLRQALNESSRQLWSNMRPRGTIDRLKVDLKYESARRDLSLYVIAQKWKRKHDVQGRNITVEPAWFPYRFEDVTGTAEYRDGQVTLTNLAGSHGKTTFTTDGNCQFSRDGWQIHFVPLSIDRLQIDEELTSALPGRLGQAAAKLNLKGPLAVHGSFSLFGKPNVQPTSAWDLSFDVENGSLNCGIALEHIHGGIERLRGNFDGQRVQSRGTVAMDSVIYKGVQLTAVRGPIWIDNARVVLGRWAGPQNVTPRLKATVFGGTLEGDAQVVFEGDSPFHLQAELKNCSLTSFSQEMAPRMRDLRGTASASLKLQGNSHGSYTWRGDGAVRVRNARISEVPVLVALLSILSIRQPDRTAFTSSDMDFDIRGDEVHFRRINFSGDVISLRGTGRVNLNKDIQFNFYTLIGRDSIPIITPILGLASQQVLQINVDGKLDQPNKPTKKVLPAVNDALRQFFPEIATRPLEQPRPQFGRPPRR